MYLKTRSDLLAKLIYEVILKIRYTFDMDVSKLPEERELKYLGEEEFRTRDGKKKIKPLLIRSGMPQGLSISPILATLVIELVKPPEGLIMYADDGVFISEKKSVRYEQ